MRICLLFILCLHTIFSASAQEGPRAVITDLFTAMRTADTAAMKEIFHPQARLTSMIGEELKAGKIDQWIASIANYQPGELDERLTYTEIRQDGNLATAWTPYAFVFKGETSHCGTNSFQLVRAGENAPWQILNVTDTRRPCPEGYDPTAALPNPVAALDSFASAWHRAAATADSAAFFDAMAEGAIYIGTDPGEHWTKEEFLEFAAPYFARGDAWSFVATERHVFFDEDLQTAHWDELLDTWMGPCRGTAVVRRHGDGWRIVHYTLSVTVANEKIEAFKKL